MKLPNTRLAVVEESKVRDYLLNTEHRFGAAKARFFGQFGFTLNNWQELAVALKRHGEENEVIRVKETGFGPRYEINGELIVPDGRRPLIPTVWQVDQGQEVPRLITAYPLEAL